MRDYYAEIDKAIKQYEEFKPYKQYTMDWVCNRIDWCYKWRKINEQQMKSLADRAIQVMDTELEMMKRR